MTYNVHSCIGWDGHLSTFRIADVIAQYEPDIVALQEIDAGRARTGFIHQAEKIAEHLNMDFHFHPSIEIKEEQYGNAILSRYPLRLIQAGALPTYKRWRTREQRGAIWASIEFTGKEVHIINTHLGLHWRERIAQAEALLSSEWASHTACCSPLIICGDFNALPITSAYRRFRRKFKDAQLSLDGTKPCKTYPSRYPIARIDHIFTSQEIEIESVHVPNTGLARIASDHLPLIAEIKI
ncbi:MAG: endonuclease/exonuclease/phosphatase family protein [Deltaproteobacteria bacterium]|nr:endonuclease/exonuclease/phosphatase family protein [Deltaproteobacteria bacterium]